MKLAEKCGILQDDDIMANKSSIVFKQTGNFRRIDSFFERALEFIKLGKLDYYGRRGVEELSIATPKDTGLAASSWYYTIERTPGSTRLVWSNSDIEGGCNVAILIQYGHATKNGFWVEGNDYINPAIVPLCNEMIDEFWRDLT